ncbi:MAG TPA: hypothetical protein VMZ69_03430 [Saprospiraceae bacterium]|nr:hypothetical protein [Saprospiraceae bacterium]
MIKPILFLSLFILFGCKKENLELNITSAKRDGQDWIAEPNASYGLHFGDSSMIISLSVPSDDGISKEAIGFYYVPLIVKQFAVIDTVLNDSNNILGLYVFLNSHGDVIQHQLWPSDEAENSLVLESYDPVTGELVFSFNVLFETRLPEPFFNWKHSFTEGKICTVLRR